jgi:hypothetical protein
LIFKLTSTIQLNFTVITGACFSHTYIRISDAWILFREDGSGGEVLLGTACRLIHQGHLDLSSSSLVPALQIYLTFELMGTNWLNFTFTAGACFSHTYIRISDAWILLREDGSGGEVLLGTAYHLMYQGHLDLSSSSLIPALQMYSTFELTGINQLYLALSP